MINGNYPGAAFAGLITGSGNLANNGTLRLVGDATLDFTGTFTNHGLLDIMTWNGTLPAGFVNDGTVLERSLVRITAVANSGNAFSLTIAGFTGHSYQLQRSDTLNSGWQNIGEPIPGNNASILFSDPVATSSTFRFYRVAVSP